MGSNGAERPRILRDQYENMLRCIRCAVCLPACPTYRETGHEAESPRGRIAIARAYVERHLDFSADLWSHMESCLLCEACTAVCPTGIKMEDLGIAFRAAVAPLVRRPRWQELVLRLAYDYVLADLSHIRRVVSLLRRYRSWRLSAMLAKTGLSSRLGLARAEALLPARIDRSLVPKGQVWEAEGFARGKVALFVGCVMSTAFADVDRATARVLARNGYTVVVTAGQGCCGALHVHNGELAGAKALARRNVDAFGALAVDAIVVNAAGCGATLKGYGHLLTGDPAYAARAASFTGKVKDITEFLATGDLVPPAGTIDATATYQAPCHLAHAQRIQAAPRKLLAAIPGLTLVEMAESDVCCGSAGIYNLMVPAMGDALRRRKIANVLATGAEIVVSANPGCMMQLEAGLRDEEAGAPAASGGHGRLPLHERGCAVAPSGRRVVVKHLVELLDEAYRCGDAIDREPRGP